MAVVFYILGWLGMLTGAGWLALTARAAAEGANAPAATAIALMLISTPATGLIIGGLLLIAVGGVITRLNRIARNTADTADAVEALLRIEEGK